MHESRVAIPYAKSLLELSSEVGALEAVQKDMALFAAVCEQNRLLIRVLKNPIINHAKKLNILKKLFTSKVTDLTMKMFDIITRKNREAFLYEIAKEFGRQYRVLKGIQTAEVITTFPLTDQLRKEFINLVASAEGKKVELSENLDEELIGGYVLKIGDRQIDESIKTKLHRLKSKFKDNPFIPKY